MGRAGLLRSFIELMGLASLYIERYSTEIYNGKGIQLEFSMRF